MRSISLFEQDLVSGGNLTQFSDGTWHDDTQYQVVITGSAPSAEGGGFSLADGAAIGGVVGGTTAVTAAATGSELVGAMAVGDALAVGTAVGGAIGFTAAAVGIAGYGLYKYLKERDN